MAYFCVHLNETLLSYVSEERRYESGARKGAFVFKKINFDVNYMRIE